MKIYRSLFYGSLFSILVIYLVLLNIVRTDSLYFILLYITNFIFLINYISYSIKNIKEYIIQLLILLCLIIIPFLLKTEFGFYPFLVTSLYLFDLGIVLGKLIISRFNISNKIKKTIFFFLPLSAVFIIPLCFIMPQRKIVTIDGIVFHLTQQPPIALLFIFLLSLYLSFIIFLSDEFTTITNFVLSVIYILIAFILLFSPIFPPYIYISIQLLNISSILIAYTVISLYKRNKLKSNYPI